MAPTPEAVFAQVATRRGAAWLDGGGAGWSILTWDPAEIVTQSTDWPAVGRALSGSVKGSGGPAPFAGGCLGYLGYGAGPVVAPVPGEAATPEPVVWLGRYLGALCYRHADDSWHLGGEPGFCREAAALLEQARPLDPPQDAARATSRTVERAVFESDVARILDWVTAGDCYQVNLTRPVHVDGAGDPWSAYRRIRVANPADHGAFLRLDDRRVVVSNSPELLLEVRDGVARSRPIKGTAPRGEEPMQDARLADGLRASAKDRAELTMIVDLVRNDLGRVARPGTVATGPRQIETLGNVHHASQEVQATLEHETDAWDALAALFPPGSVTGAPKVRACQRIAELEREPRGVYCGAIGFVDAERGAGWSVAIRTAIFDGARARYHVGGGIVAASDPAAEWEETVAKGRALAKALGVRRG